MALMRVTVVATYTGYIHVDDGWKPGMRMEPVDALARIKLPQSDQFEVKSIDQVRAVCVSYDDVCPGWQRIADGPENRPADGPERPADGPERPADC